MSVADVKIRVADGKYTFVKGDTSIAILRHGEPWHEQSEGFNALFSIMVELDAARVVLLAARALGDTMPLSIADALAKHERLVSDHEPPSAWSSP
jgi:hypothetical protein